VARNTKIKKKKTGDSRPTKKKTSLLTLEGIEYVDYKDVNMLRRFMSERAKIRARRVNGNDRQQQAEISRAIKIAREMALLPYSVRQVTQRKGGRRGDRGDRGDRRRDDRPRDDGAEQEAVLDAATEELAAAAEPAIDETTMADTMAETSEGTSEAMTEETSEVGEDGDDS
jgi:small subunit ribosomal protein S18